MSELDLLLFEFLLDELLDIAQFGQLDLLLLYDEGRNVPLSLLVVPLRFLLDLVNLLVRHQVPHHLVQEVQLLRLLTPRVQQFLILVSVLSVEVFQLILGTLQLGFQLSNDVAAIVNFFLQGAIVLLFLKELCLLALPLFQ